MLGPVFLEPFHMYDFFKQYRSSGTVFGTVHAVRGQIENGMAYFWFVQPFSNWTVRMNGPDLILNFLNRINGTEVSCRVRVANMTHDHDDTLHAIFNTTSGTCWKVSVVIDFDLKNRNCNLPACFSALICDFSQFNKIPLSKTTKTRVLRIFANLLFVGSWKWGKLATYKCICLEILFLLIYHIQLRTSQLWNQEQEMIFEALVYMTHWTNCHHDTLFQTWLK